MSEQKKKSVGIILIGQSTRKDALEDIDMILEPEFSIVAKGLLDGMTFDDVKDKLWPSGSEFFIISTLEDGTIIKIKESLLNGMIQSAINDLENQGIFSSLLICTGKFHGLEKHSMVLEPADVISFMLQTLNIDRLGILVPEKEQIEESLLQYKQYSPIIKAVNPYEDIKYISERAREFKTEPVDTILMDCMGYTKAMGDLVKAESGKNVIVPRVAAATLLKTLA